MSESRPDIGINSWLEDELYQQYLNDRRAVDESWKEVFESNGGTPPPHENGSQTVQTLNPSRPAPASVPAHQTVSGETLIPLRGVAARIAENMNASLTIPIATSQRILPVKVIDENRRILNDYRTLVGKGKISYTHIIGWAIVKAIAANPTLNHAYAETREGAFRVVRERFPEPKLINGDELD